MKEILKQIIIYTAVSFVMAILFNVMSGASFKCILYDNLFVICFSITLSFVVINHVFNVGDKFSKYKPFKKSLFILVDVSICTFIGLLIAKFLFYVLWIKSFYFSSNQETLMGAFVIGLIITIFSSTYFILKERIEKAQSIIYEAEKEKIILAKMKAESDLQAVQGKLNPHFLFNSLNSIASLIQINPIDAESMTLKLSELFRNLIDNDVKTLHSVEDEFDMLKNYLSIEKIRFSDRLTFEFRNDLSKEFMIPKLILQPLVENVIKHVITPAKNGGSILISAENKDEHLILTVADSGKGFDLDAQNGYGLKHIKDRLDLIYGDKYDVQINHSDLFEFKILLF